MIVYKDNIDNIIGYIHSSEMFKGADEWQNNIRTIPFVPETMAAHKLMRIFKQQKRSLAVVVDEFGGVSGIVALEDLIEEILGDIEDEHDTNSVIARKSATTNTSSPDGWKLRKPTKPSISTSRKAMTTRPSEASS